MKRLDLSGNYIINWCPMCHTAISILKSSMPTATVTSEYQNIRTKAATNLWWWQHPTGNLLGDTGVAIHPKISACPFDREKCHSSALMGRIIPIFADDMWIVNSVPGRSK
jgi:valyl-tRNA synthetase